MGGYEDVFCRIEGPVAYLTVARADRLNAMRDQTADELLAALDALEANEAVRAVIVSGEGRAFGAGYDLSTVEPDSTPDLGRVLDAHFNPLVRRMRGSRLPLVAAVRGACAGASVGIALACDVVLAEETVFFYEPFVGIALVPDAGNTLFLPRAAGRIRAGAAMLLGDRIGAAEARDWGLVWKLCAPGALDAEALATARRLADRAPGAVAATKALIARAAEPDLDAQLDLERDLQDRVGRSPEMKAAIAAFLVQRGGRAQ